MAKTGHDRHDGHKVQMWVSDELYAALKERAERHDASVAEALRQAAMAGPEPLHGLATIQDVLTDLKQFTKFHLEPLAFVAAMDSAYLAAAWHTQWAAAPQFVKSPQDLEKLEHQLRQKATQRVQRKLRALPGDEEEH